MTKIKTVGSNLLRAAVVAAFSVIAAAPVSAQTLGLGTTKGGATAQIGTAPEVLISLNSDLQVIPQVSANTSQYIPQLDSGQLELAIANYPQTYYAMTDPQYWSGGTRDHR